MKDKTNQSLDTELQYYLIRNKLSFSPGLENLFIKDYFLINLGTVRIALILGIVLYGIFGILDFVLVPSFYFEIWMVRYAVVLPWILFILLMTFHKSFSRIMPLAIGTVSFLAGFGILYMIVVMTGKDVNTFYYAGLILVIMWNYTILKLRFFHALCVASMITIGYELVSVFFLKSLESSNLINTFISNNFFFISSNIIGMFTSYLMEIQARKDFLQRILIQESQKKINKESNLLKIRNESMESELDMARKIQLKLIPTEDPAHYISSIYKPMEAVGGDLYHYILFRGKDQIGIFLSDVSGHGVPAALITFMIKSIIQQSYVFRLDPAQLLLNLNSLLINQTDNNFVTAFYGVYDLGEKSFTYANAGHNLPILVTHESKFIDIAIGMPLAILDNAAIAKKNKTFQNNRIDLPSNSKLLFYTDGLTEATHKDDLNHSFEDEIFPILCAHKSLKPKQFIAKIYEELVTFHGKSQFDDDICIICMDTL
jgi:serine phosphatase RsbU (regulator of sigma subunit)